MSAIAPTAPVDSKRRSIRRSASGFAAALAAFVAASVAAHEHSSWSVAKTSAPLQPRSLAPLWVGPAHSGSWYNPSRSGEGFTLQILDNGTALAVWFTYPPAGSAARQAWIFAQDGHIDGDRIRFATVFTTRGPRFGSTYDPAQLQVIPWGSLEFHLFDCNNGEFTYAGPPGWGSGTRGFVRLTALSELECSGKRLVAGARLLSGLQQRGGGIFDPSHNGEGWMLEELANGQTLVYWFTYDASGEQAWTIGVSNTSGAKVAVADNLQPVGTHFGADFDPAQVSSPSWGSLQIDFAGCDTGLVSYQSTMPSFGSGILHPVRLTRLAGSACVEGMPTVPSGTWSAAAKMPDPAQSEIAIAVLGNRAWVAGGVNTPFAFKSYNFDTDAWSIGPDMPGGRDHAEGLSFGGDIYVTGGNRGTPEGEQAVSGFRYDPASNQWTSVPQLPDVVASGATMLNGFAYFGSAGADIFQMNTETLATRRIPHDPAVTARDHSQLVAFQGELWMIGGRDLTTAIEHPRVSIFDPASETWRTGPSLLTARAGFAAAASPSLLIVAGGEHIVGQFRVVNAVEAIVPGAQQWSALPSLPVAVHGVGGALYNNAFYAIGGSIVPAATANRGDVQVFRWGS